MTAIRILYLIILLALTNVVAFLLLNGFSPDWRLFAAVGIGMPAGMLFTFLITGTIEARSVGYQRSSFGRLFSSPSPSARTDWFYLLFGMSGLKPVFAFIFSLGLTAAVVNLGQGRFNFQILTQAPWVLQIAVFALVKSLGFYLVHALMHSRFFWRIHQVHHSATELTVLTPHRNHPVDAAVVTLVNAVPAILLGVSPSVVAVYMFLNGFYQSLVHSQLTWGKPWMDRYILFSPEAHRIHHSNDPAHWHKNLGTIPVWDHLFGTFLSPEGQTVKEIGFVEERLHNTGRPWAEVAPVLFNWIGGVAPREESNVVT